MTTVFDDDVVQAVCRHMDADHADSALLIVQQLGGVVGAVSVRTVGVDGDAVHFVAVLADGRSVPVRVPFAAPVSERPQIRLAVVALHDRARAAAGPTEDPA